MKETHYKLARMDQTKIGHIQRMEILKRDKNKICSFLPTGLTYFGLTYFGLQGMGCEGACAHTQVQCAVARVRVRAKRLLKHVCEVCASGHF